MKTKKLTNKNLNALKGDNALKNYVIDHLINNYSDHEERFTFANDLLSQGCISGMVSGLIYYSDTNKFYDEFQEEIYNLADDQAQEIGYTNANDLFAKLNGAKNVGTFKQDKNLKAWYAFEEMTRIILQELNIEL